MLTLSFCISCYAAPWATTSRLRRHLEYCRKSHNRLSLPKKNRLYTLLSRVRLFKQLQWISFKSGKAHGTVLRVEGQGYMRRPRDHQCIGNPAGTSTQPRGSSLLRDALLGRQYESTHLLRISLSSGWMLHNILDPEVALRRARLRKRPAGISQMFSLNGTATTP